MCEKNVNNPFCHLKDKRLSDFDKQETPIRSLYNYVEKKYNRRKAGNKIYEGLSDEIDIDLQKPYLIFFNIFIDQSF